MTEHSIKIAIPLLLPEVSDAGDHCLDRLEKALQNQRGIHRAHLKREQSPAQLCLHYDTDLLSGVEVQHLAKRAATRICKRYRHRMVTLEGLDCSDCALVVEHSLARMEGILKARVNYATQTLQVEYDTQAVRLSEIEKRIHDLGYHVVLKGIRGWYRTRREMIFSFLSGLALALSWLVEKAQFAMPLYLTQSLSLAFFLVAYFFGGYDVVRSGLRSLRSRHFDTDLLMLVAALGAAILGRFAEGALLLFLFSLGRALEEHYLNRAREAVRALANLTPRVALVVRNGREVEVPVDEIAIGETVIVKPGVRFAVDGEVIHGNSLVNQAPVTGEEMPVEKGPGDMVFAGTINGERVLQVRTTRLARDSTMARVIRLVEHAQGQKSPVHRLTERIMRIFVPLVLIGDLLLILIPPLFGVPLSESFYKAMTLLVAASPCALALGTPAAILSGIAQAARQGILVKGGGYLEILGSLKAIAFDKTGTVTAGQPEVTDVLVWSNETDTPRVKTMKFSPDLAQDDRMSEVLRLAASVEAHSAHPLASALINAARGLGLEMLAVEQAQALTGWGAEARLDGSWVYVGRPEKIRVYESENQTLAAWRKAVTALEDQGKTVIVVAKDGEIIGGIAIADQLRPGVKECLQSLKRFGIARVTMLTGDNERVAARIAAQVGVDDYHANLLPQEKLERIRNLIEQYGQVGMVGDGVNDAPALAAATVGIALGGATTDVALETADVVLMAENLSKLPFAIDLGRATRAVIWQNFIIALLVMIALVVFSLSRFADIGIAVLFHEGSTLLVVLNALRLLSYRAKAMV